MDLQIRFFLFTAEGAEGAEEEKREKLMEVYCSINNGRKSSQHL
jgi:hypothetical protein